MSCFNYHENSISRWAGRQRRRRVPHSAVGFAGGRRRLRGRSITPRQRLLLSELRRRGVMELLGLSGSSTPPGHGRAGRWTRSSARSRQASVKRRAAPPADRAARALGG